MKTKFQLAATAAVMATASMALYAAVPAAAQKMDADGDKTITWAEAKTKSDAMWVKLDVNKDGKIDKADQAAKWAEKFAMIDTDKNGSISRDEFVAHHAQMMDGGMKDGKGHDGMAGAGDPDAHKRWGQGGERRGDHGGKHGGKGGHGMMGGGMHMLAMADANKDGAVTRAEFDTATKAHFDKADANKDGKVSPDERRAAMKSMMGMMRGPGGHGGGMGAMGDGPPPPPPAN